MELWTESATEVNSWLPRGVTLDVQTLHSRADYQADAHLGETWPVLQMNAAEVDVFEPNTQIFRRLKTSVPPTRVDTHRADPQNHWCLTDFLTKVVSRQYRKSV